MFHCDVFVILKIEREIDAGLAELQKLRDEGGVNPLFRLFIGHKGALLDNFPQNRFFPSKIFNAV